MRIWVASVNSNHGEFNVLQNPARRERHPQAVVQSCGGPAHADAASAGTGRQPRRPRAVGPGAIRGFFSAPEIASKNPATQQILLLDGNHRRTVAETIGLKYIPVVFIGWEEFEVDVWNRALPLENSDGLDELLARFGLSESQPAPTESGFRHALLHYQGNTHSFPENDSDKIKQHQQVGEFFEALEEWGHHTQNCFITQQATEESKANPDHLVVELPRFEKEELLALVQHGAVLPAKAYRTLLLHGPCGCRSRSSPSGNSITCPTTFTKPFATS